MKTVTNLVLVYRALSSRRWMGVPEISAKTGIGRRQVRSILNRLDGIYCDLNWTRPVHDDSPLWRRIPVAQLSKKGR